MKIKINDKTEENNVNYTQNESNNLSNPSLKYNKINPINLDDVDNTNTSINKSIQSEYKIIPKNDDKLCLMDPVILFWIISITGILLYIVGHKYKSK